MKKDIEIYNLLTEKSFNDELERKYLNKEIQNQYELNSARKKNGKLTIYRSMRDLALEIQNKEKSLKYSEKINEKNDIRYKYKGNNRTIEIVAPKEMIEQGVDTRFDFIPESIKILDATSEKVQKKYAENLRIKKSITKFALAATILVGSILGTIKLFDNLDEKERRRQAQRNEYSTYYDYYKDVMPLEKYKEMVEQQKQANKYSKTK